MLRETLTATIKKAAITEGYAFHIGFAYRINNGIAKFPAAWLLPVRIIAVEGRRDGYLTYQMTLYLMHLDKKPRPESRERQWAELEIAALRILDNIYAGRQIFDIAKIGCTPAENTLTNYGEIALKIECEVRMRFCPADSPLED